jgi:hypothetical protein
MKIRLILRFVLVFAGLFAAIWGVSIFLTRSVVGPGDVVFNRISSHGADWIELYNRTGRIIDLSGFLLSDGKSTYTLPEGTSIQPKGSLVMVRDKDEPSAKAKGIKPDLTWTGFGFGHEKREFALLLNKSGNLMIDFVHTIPLEEDQVLEREPTGSQNWWIAESGKNKIRVDLEAGARSGVDRTAVAQTALDAVQFLKQFTEGISGTLAAFCSIIVIFGGRKQSQLTPQAASAASTSG